MKNAKNPCDLPQSGDSPFLSESLERSSDLSNSGKFKSRLPQKLQSKSTLSCEIVPIHSLFRHGFIKKPKVKLLPK